MDEVELFAMAGTMLVEVLGRIREPDLDIELPAVAGVTGDHPATLRAVVERHEQDEAGVLRILGEDPARGCDDGDRVVATPYGELSVREYLLRTTVVRSLVAHYVAAYLGSTACPLPEELARPLWELTADDAAGWRETGLFRPPLPIPPLASWRDVFLRTAGHEPHPLGH